MGLLAWLFGPRSGVPAGTYKEVSCEELFAAAEEAFLRSFAFEVCVDMVANALGRCEFKTYRGGEEIQEREYWTWNVEPNLNENSSVFLHKLIDHLYRTNEALVVSFNHRDGHEMLVVADSWVPGDPKVTRMNEYEQVTVDGYTFSKRFREDDVLHLRLNQTNIKPVVEMLNQSWGKMLALAKQHYEWDRGQHWKVHINQLASGDDDFTANFAKMLEQQVKPFISNPNGVLPEFDGYKYEAVGGSGYSQSAQTSADIRDLAADIFDFTARGFLIPAVLVNGKVEATKDANNRFLTYVVDPLCDQIQEEANRKRYGYEQWKAGNFLRIDSSSIIHYDLFDQAASVEKLIGSGVYTINDILRAVGQATINEPWADKHYLTKNIAEMGAVTEVLGE